jgi:hypothetical protein
MPGADDPNGDHAGEGDVGQVDDRAGAESDSKGARRRWLPRLGPVGRWAAGVLATVTATAIIGWLLAWGVLPDRQPTAPTVETAPSTSSDSRSPQPSSGPDDEPFTVAVIPIARTTIGWILPLSPEEAHPRPAADEVWDGWVERTGAVSINSHTVLFTVQGTSEAQVTLTDMRIRVTERRPRRLGLAPICGRRPRR